MWPNDEKLSWLVAFGSFMCQFAVMGFYNNFGLLYVELLREHKGNDEIVIAWIGSVSFGLVFIFGPITTMFITRFGCRAVMLTGGVIFGVGLFSSSYVNNIYQLYVTYCFIFAFGSSFCYCTSILILNEYFSKRLVLANGIALAGNGVGTLLIAPVMNGLLNNFHWRQTLRVFSVLSVILVLCGLIYLLVPAPIHLQLEKTTTERRRKLLDLSVFQNKAFIVWVAAVSLVMFGYYIPFVHLIQHSQDLGIAKSKGFMLVGVVGLSQTVGKIFYGQVSDHPRVNRINLLQMALLVCSVMTTLLPVFTSYSSLMTYCVIFGLHDGCFMLLVAVLTGDIAGRKNMVSALGLTYLITCSVMTLGPPVAGWMYDSTQKYEPAFYMTGAFTTLAVCLLFLIPLLLPPDVQGEWRERSKSCQSRIPATDSNPTSKKYIDPKVPPNSENSTKLRAELNTEAQERKREFDLGRNKTFTQSRRSMVEKYFLVETLVSLEECVPSLSFRFSENLWGQIATSRETNV